MRVTGPVEGSSEPAVQATAPGPCPGRTKKAVDPGVAASGRQGNTGRWWGRGGRRKTYNEVKPSPRSGVWLTFRFYFVRVFTGNWTLVLICFPPKRSDLMGP